MRLAYRAMLSARRLGPSPRCRAIGVAQPGQAIERIYVINLDRHTERWDRMCGELSHLTDNSGRPFSAARRFHAVDGRQLSEPPTPAAVRPSYSLADQFFVEPHPVLHGHFDAGSWDVEMTRQEVAVALSHIAVWELVAASDCAYTLILEDDVYFKRGFCRDLDKAWSDLVWDRGARSAFDLLYVSYKEARTGKRAVPVSDSIFKPVSGLWQLSGYVVSRKGARRLLDALPVRGPVDTWINHQFEAMDVFATRRSIVEQRSDCRSANLYSILPVLSQVGVFTREKPLLARSRPAATPVFAFGEQGSGLTALGLALSMLGYRCCSDLTELPAGESERLFENKSNRVFDAYVNVGSLTADDYIQLARTHPNARFIVSHNTLDGDTPVDGHHERELQTLVEELRRTRDLLFLRADGADSGRRYAVSLAVTTRAIPIPIAATPASAPCYTAVAARLASLLRTSGATRRHGSPSPRSGRAFRWPRRRATQQANSPSTTSQEWTTRSGCSAKTHSPATFPSSRRTTSQWTPIESRD